MKTFKKGMRVIPSSTAKDQDWWPLMRNIKWPAKVIRVDSNRVFFKTGEDVNFYGMGDVRAWRPQNLVEFRMEENE